jgi:hypothetical protein
MVRLTNLNVNLTPDFPELDWGEGVLKPGSTSEDTPGVLNGETRGRLAMVGVVCQRLVDSRCLGFETCGS